MEELTWEQQKQATNARIQQVIAKLTPLGEQLLQLDAQRQGILRQMEVLARGIPSRERCSCGTRSYWDIKTNTEVFCPWCNNLTFAFVMEALGFDLNTLPSSLIRS